MLDLVLYEPEIPPNTGNVIRLCANTGMRLHLVQPLGFDLEDRQLRRAGLDYHEWAQLRVHPSLHAALDALAPQRVFAFSTRGTARYHEVSYRTGDLLLFGPETRGLPADVLGALPPGHVLRIPMQPNSRSLNLSNAVALVAYEAWRQLGFPGAT